MINLKKVAIATISAGVLVGAIFASAQTMATSFQFTQNMKLGSSGAQVLQLQKTLNSEGYTVATAGVGSSGMESTYFGAKTKAAVIKFQAANNVPATGNVFALTRAALNGLSVAPVVTGTTTTTISGPVTVALATVQPNSVVVASSSHVKLADLVFTGNGIVNSLKLMRTGISNNQTLVNVYLYDSNGNRITDSSSVLTDGSINFNSGTGLFSVSGSQTISVYADVAGATSGQSVGVSVVGYSTVGNPAAVVSGVNGPVLPIGSVTIVSATIATTSVNTSPNVGDQNVNLWEATVQLTRDSYVNGGTFKLVGSAPFSSFANVKLFVDSVQVGNAVTADALGNLSFVANQFVRAGSHDVAVRADIVGGAGRSYYVSLQQGSDLLFQDAQVPGAYAMPTLTNGQSFYNLRLPVTDANIGSCSGSSGCANLNSDTTFNAVTLPSGSSQQTIGSLVFSAYGEPVKLMSAYVNVLGSVSTSSISNVSVYVNGVQVTSGGSVLLTGSNTGTSGIYLSNLGGTVVNPGTPVTIQVKADLRDTTGANLPSQTLTAYLNSLQIQGQQSYNTQTLGTGTSNSVTVGSLSASFSANSNFSGGKIAGTASNALLGSFTVAAGSYEGLTLTGVNLTLNPGNSLDLSQVTGLNLVDTTSSSTIGTRPSVGSGTSPNTVAFSTYLNIPAGSSKILNVYGTINNAPNGGQLSIVATASYQGLISLAQGTKTATSASTTIATAGLASVERSAAALSSRYVVGGTVNNIGVFTLSATGTSFNATKIHVLVSNPNLVSAVSVAGVNALSQGNGLYTVDLSASPVSISTIGTDVPVNVTFNSADKDNNSYAGQTTTIGLTYIYGNAGSGSVVTLGTDFTATGGNPVVLVANATTTATSSAMTLVGAMPHVSMSNNSVSSSGGSTLSNQSVGTVTITPVGGVVDVTQFKVNLPANVTITSGRIVDSTGAVVTNATIATSTGIVTLNTGNISSSVSYTVQISGSVSNSVTGSISLGASLGDVSTLHWDDLTGGDTAGSGTKTGSALLVNYNN
jgi:peptidoglycan hydrolase-like protein with peptidoglycan-binding domain